MSTSITHGDKQAGSPLEMKISPAEASEEKREEDKREHAEREGRGPEEGAERDRT